MLQVHLPTRQTPPCPSPAHAHGCGGVGHSFIMLSIWLLPSDSTCSLPSASRESILEIRLLNKLRSSRFTRLSRPSMTSMLLKDRSGGREGADL